MKRLYLCRHAKSSWDLPELKDWERPLSKRGKRDLPLMGKRVAGLGLCPQGIYTSPAVRALATATGLAHALSVPAGRVVVEETMYGATPHTLLNLIQALPQELHSVALVGHNPEMTSLANMLAPCGLENMPTCSVVAIELPGDSWASVTAGTGRMVFFEFPKKIRS